MAQRQFRLDDTSIWQERFGNGSSGAHTPSSSTDAQPNTVASGTSGTTTLTVTSGTGFANGNLVLIHQTRGTGAGVWELNKIASGGGTTTLTLSYTLTATYTSSGASAAQVYKLNQYSSANIAGGVTINTSAWNGTTGGVYAFLCSGDVTIAGSINGSGGGFRGGNNWNAVREGNQGEGTLGTGTNDFGSGSSNANGNGGGAGTENAGNASSAGGGGGGGNGTAGATGNGGTTSSNAGTGGNTAGSVSLITMVPGGGGGQGGGQNSTPGAGGAGGSIIIIIGKRITITGTLVTGGSVGTSPGVTDGAGGGGGGGSVLIKGQTLTLGSGLVTAPGASGGNGSGGAGNGGLGGAGRIHADYGSILSGTTTPTIDSTQDSSLLDAGGAFIYNLI